MSNNNLIIRSSSVEFLIFDRQIHKKGIEVRFEDGDLWLTQKAISELYNIDRTVVTKHLKNIFEDYELDKSSVCAIYAHTAKDGKTYKTNYYNLDAVISDSLAALAHYAGNQKLKGCCKKTNTPIKNLWDKIQCDCKRIFK